MLRESFHNEILSFFEGEMKRSFTGMHIGMEKRNQITIHLFLCNKWV